MKPGGGGVRRAAGRSTGSGVLSRGRQAGLALASTSDHIRRLGEVCKDLVRDDAGVTVWREVVLPLQGRRLARSAHQVHRSVLGDEVGAGPIRVEAGRARPDIKDDQLHVVRSIVAETRGSSCSRIMLDHWEH